MNAWSEPTATTDLLPPRQVDDSVASNNWTIETKLEHRDCHFADLW
jgi:hypothetical protein